MQKVSRISALSLFLKSLTNDFTAIFDASWLACYPERKVFIGDILMVVEVVHNDDFLDVLFARMHTNLIESRVSVML